MKPQTMPVKPLSCRQTDYAEAQPFQVVEGALLPAIQRRIQLSFAHRVYFTENLFDPANPMLGQVLLQDPSARKPKVLVVLDEGLEAAQPDLPRMIENCFKELAGRAELAGAPVVLEGGERVKNSYFHVSEIQSYIDRYGIDRHSYLLAVGGGALLDVAGLAAATAHRGIRHLRVPTTTLSQADSGVGVKNGINAFGKKNFVGAFAVPAAVINDFSFLRFLSPRDKRAGYSEAVKVASIRDAAFFASLERDAAELAAFDSAAMRRLIHRSAQLHVNHIADGGDPFEFGSARPLDFGHWAAHKLEQLSGYSIRHGEAVALGMALDTTYSQLAGLLPESDAERVLQLLETLGFSLYANEFHNTDSAGELMVLRGLEEFRLHLGGPLTLTMLQGIGQGIEIHEMDHSIIGDALQALQRRHHNRFFASPLDFDTGATSRAACG
jgi:3-dehydroquinate synthase